MHKKTAVLANQLALYWKNKKVVSGRVRTSRKLQPSPLVFNSQRSDRRTDSVAQFTASQTIADRENLQRGWRAAFLFFLFIVRF